MPYQETVYNRVRLYEEVWSQPMREVAKAYGVSDVALKKMCRQLGVPTPPQGYWLMREDRRPERWPLGPIEPGEEEEHVVTKWVDPPRSPPSPVEQEMEALVAKRPDLQHREIVAPFKIEVPQSMHGLHPLAGEARRAVQKGYFGRDGLSSTGGGLALTVSKGQLDRALRILSCLFRAVEKAGHHVKPYSPADSTRPHFYVDGEKIEFAVRERLTQTPHVPKANEFWPSKWDHHPKGDLRLTIGGMRWEDTPKAKIEDQINQIFTSILSQAAGAKVSRARDEERARIQRAADAKNEEARRIEAERQRRVAAAETDRKRRIDELVSDAEDWERAVLVRRFIEAVRARLNERAGPGGLPKETLAWLNWADATAKEMDPLFRLVPDEKTHG